MFYFFVFMNLIFVGVDCQITEQNLESDINLLTTPSLEQETQNDLLPSMSNSDDTTQIWQELTSEKPFEEENLTITSTINSIIANNATYSLNFIHDIIEETKKEMKNTIFRDISNELNKKFELMEARLLALSCSNDEVPSSSSSSSSSLSQNLSWQIYENLQISLNGWSRVFDQSYSHATRVDDLNQIVGLCHNQVIVAATFNQSISLAAVGPANVLTLNTTWNKPEQFGQVYWYRTSGKSFGFSPSPIIRQTSADNEDLGSPLRLSWLLDQNIGGYRAGITRALHNNSQWHKVIYCN